MVVADWRGNLATSPLTDWPGCRLVKLPGSHRDGGLRKKFRQAIRDRTAPAGQRGPFRTALLRVAGGGGRWAVGCGSGSGQAGPAGSDKPATACKGDTVTPPVNRVARPLARSINFIGPCDDFKSRDFKICTYHHQTWPRVLSTSSSICDYMAPDALRIVPLLI